MREKADLGATSHSFLLIKLRISHPGMTPHRPDDTFVLQFPPSPSAKMNSIFAFPLLLSHLNPTIKPLSPLEWMQSWPPSVHKYDIREPDPQFPSQRHWKKVWNNANKSEVIIFRNYLKHCAHLFFETAEFKGHHPTARVISERELAGILPETESNGPRVRSLDTAAVVRARWLPLRLSIERVGNGCA